MCSIISLPPDEFVRHYVGASNEPPLLRPRDELRRYLWKAAPGQASRATRAGPPTRRSSSAPMTGANDTSRAFIAKARRYVDRGMDEPHGSEEHAYWLHFAVEPLLRAAVAHAHPALLADPRSDTTMLTVLGVIAPEEPAAMRSRSASSLVKLLAAVDARQFDAAFAQRISTFLDRRNAEAHAEAAAMTSVASGWRDDFLRVAKALCDFAGIQPDAVLGNGLAEMAESLSERDQAAVVAEFQRLLAEAKARDVPKVEPSAFTEATYRDGRVSRAVECPACANQAYLTGWPIRRSDPVLVDGELARRVAVATRRFDCPQCELALSDRQLVVAAGLDDVFETTEPVDPYEALTLDPAEEVERMGLVVVDPSWEE